MKELNRETENEMDIRDYFWLWIISLPFWFISSCERSYNVWNETAFHKEINVGIPLIILILVFFLLIKSYAEKYLIDRLKTQNIVSKIVFCSIGIAIVFSILNLFGSLDWFHNFFPIFVENTSLF